MSWFTEWSALSNRIKGVVEAGHFYFLTVSGKSGNEYSSVHKQILKPYSEDIYKGIESYLDTYRSSISSAGIECITNFINTLNNHINNEDWGKLRTVQFVITSLASFRSEFGYHLSDIQSISRRLTERAFVHLQRSIVADTSIRDKWKKAFNKRETACEELGSVHLLSHGIWAFKTSATGERTDLILSEPLINPAQIEETDSTLVLTEWKKVGNKTGENLSKTKLSTELKEQSEAALKQAKLYNSGILAGFELANYRYLILVSEKRLADLPPDISENNIIYHYINIAVDPKPPSK